MIGKLRFVFPASKPSTLQCSPSSQGHAAINATIICLSKVDLELVKKIKLNNETIREHTETLYKMEHTQEDIGMKKNRILECETSASSIKGNSSPFCSDFVIGGVGNNREISLKAVSYALPRSVYLLMEPRKVVAARSLSRPRNAESVPVTGETSQDDPSCISTAIHLKLISDTLVQQIIKNKIARRRLLKTDLNVNLLTVVKAMFDSKFSRTVNINEFLSSNLHRLRNTILIKAKKRNFTSFIRNYRIYVRRSKREAAVKIETPEELKNFLEMVQK